MNTALRNILILLLATLQLMSPLVHAHVGEEMPGTGLHRHGLEIYDHSHDAPLLTSDTSHLGIDSHVICINTGIKLSKPLLTDSSVNYGQPQYNSLVNVQWLAFSVNFSPWQGHVKTSLSFHPFSPRAPPVVS